jgi:hypothetical protein
VGDDEFVGVEIGYFAVLQSLWDDTDPPPETQVQPRAAMAAPTASANSR